MNGESYRIRFEATFACDIQATQTNFHCFWLNFIISVSEQRLLQVWSKTRATTSSVLQNPQLKFSLRQWYAYCYHLVQALYYYFIIMRKFPKCSLVLQQ